MCHYRGSHVSEERANADADRQKELETQRTRTADALLHEAYQAAQKAPTAPVKELIPAK